MSFGAGIFLLVVGAILSFAVKDSFDTIDLTTTGYILMGAGVLGILLGLVLSLRKSKSVSTTRSNIDPVSGEGVTVSERSVQ